MEKSQKIPLKYHCEFCDYNTSNKKDYNKHITTPKHKNRTISNDFSPKNPQNVFFCKKCNKEYKVRNSLWYHEQKCNYNNIVIQKEQETNESHENVKEDTLVDSGINMQLTIVELLKQNQDFQKQIIELMKDNVGNHITNNTTNTNSNNKFNLNVFLNEKCKDALNLTDFITNLNVGFTDFENFGKIGYSNSITNIFIRGLKELDVYKRPIHCSDLKREVIHVKDDNTWKKDDEKEQMIKAIKMIEHKNIKQIPDWIKAHPAHADIRSKKFDEYSKMLDQSMGEYEDEDNQKNYQKIIRSVAKEILVEKD